MANRRSLEARAAESERKNKWLRARLAAQKRPEVAVLVKALVNIGAASEAAEASDEDMRTVIVDSLGEAYRAVAKSLARLGVEIPE